MYIVRDKTTRKILHVNPAPVSQRLAGADIYYRLDLATMEVGQGELPDVPEHFDIDARGAIVPWTLERQVKQGVRQLAPELKAVGDTVVAKTLAEQVADGSVVLGPTEKLVGDRLELKTPAEQVADGTLALAATQTVDGDIVREMTSGELAAAGLLDPGPLFKVVDKQIVAKTLGELVADGIVALAADEQLQGDQIIQLTPRELLDAKRLDLKAYKQAALARYTEASLAERRTKLPDHVLLYAALGALDAATTDSCKKLAAKHASALTKIASAIDAAATADDVDAAVGLGAWPRQGVARVALPAQAASPSGAAPGSRPR